MNVRCFKIAGKPFVPVMVMAMIFSAFLFSNILGIVMDVLLCYDNIPDLWCYFFNENTWLARHNHGIGTTSFSYDSFWISDVLLLAFAIVVIIHLVFCFKRCKDIGISGWWCLVPLFNPIALLLRKSFSETDGESTSNAYGQQSLSESLQKFFRILSFE